MDYFEILDLPSELIIEILLKCNKYEIYKFSLTSKNMKNICNLVWKIKYKEDFNDQNDDDYENWLYIYIETWVNDYCKKMRDILKLFVDKNNSQKIVILDIFFKFILDNKDILKLKKTENIRKTIKYKINEFKNDGYKNSDYFYNEIFE